MAVVAVAGVTARAQDNSLRDAYEDFKRQAQQEYNDFRDNANREYAEFIKAAWEWYEAKPAVPKPDEKPIPPVIFDGEEDTTPDDTPQPYDEVLPIVRPDPQPVPVSPIEETPAPQETYFKFSFFNTEGKVRLEDRHRFRLPACGRDNIADEWQKLAGKDYNNAIRDCLELRIRHKLSDWGYLMMLQCLSDAFLGKGTNEATLLTSYLYCQSGYEMRLAMKGDKLFMFYGSKHIVYDLPYVVLDGERYYPFNGHEQSYSICGAKFPNEKPLSLVVGEEPLLAVDRTAPRTLQAKNYPDVRVDVVANRNLLDFMESYPSSSYGENICSRWAMYANTPLSQLARERLYPVLREAISGKSQKDAANILINFVQTAFVYGYDDKVWGGDRAFFADETLYYPYSDCEDRAILFTRLVRDLLGLKTALVYYPGHLASAVHFTENITGDYLSINGTKYLVCDPTYIGAPIGLTMPKMDNSTAKVILLN